MDKAMKGEMEMDNERQLKGIIEGRTGAKKWNKNYYENQTELLEFLKDIAETNKDTDLNTGIPQIELLEYLRDEFQFIYDEINDFLNRRNIK